MTQNSWEPVIQSPEIYLKDPKTILLKYDRVSTVGLLEEGGHKIIIKEHKMRSLWKGIKSLVIPSRGQKSLQNALLLKSLKIPTLDPIANVDRKITPFKKHSFFIYRYIEGVNLKALIENDKCIDDAILNECVKVICLLKKHRISHGDLKIANWIISSSSVWLIDIHALRLHHSSKAFEWDHRRDVARFLYCFSDYPIIKQRCVELFKKAQVDVDHHMLQMRF